MRFLFIILIAFTVLIGVVHPDNGDTIAPSDTLDFPEIYDGDWGKYPPMPIEGKCPQPEYPAEALADSVKGKVWVSVYVDLCGLVKEWRVVQEKPEGQGFAREVEKVLPNWEFNPALLQAGKPVGAWIAIPFTFNPPNPNK